MNSLCYIMRMVAKWIGWVNEHIGRSVSWLTTVLVLVVCFDVFTRYVLKWSWVWVQELQWHLFAVVFLLGAAYTLKHDRHVRVDVFYARFSERGKAVVDLAGSLLFLLPFCLIFVWASKEFVIVSFEIREGSPDPGGLPARYVMRAFIPLAMALLFFQGVAQAMSAFVRLRGGTPESEPVEYDNDVSPHSS